MRRPAAHHSSVDAPPRGHPVDIRPHRLKVAIGRAGRPGRRRQARPPALAQSSIGCEVATGIAGAHAVAGLIGQVPLLVDPAEQEVSWLALRDGDYRSVRASELIELGPTELAAQIDWP